MKTTIHILIFILTLAIFSCKKKETAPSPTPAPVSDPVDTKVKIGETYLMGCAAKALVYADKSFEVGYNKIYVSLYDSLSGSKLSNGHFHLNAVMDMGTMQHACPVENSEDTSAVNGYFQGAVVFSMAGTSSQWALHLNFHNHKNGKEGTASIGVEVKASTPSKMFSTTLTLDSNRVVFVTLIQPISPKVGINELEILINEKKNMMEFPFSSRYTVEIEPHMPSMAHGSPNNVNPIHHSKGHYKGKVNYTMTGLWRVKVKLFKDGTLVSDDKYFEMTL